MYKGEHGSDFFKQLRREKQARAFGTLTGWLLMAAGMGQILGTGGVLLVVGFWMAVPARYVKPD